MRSNFNSLCVAAALSLGLGTAAPVSAAPVFNPAPVAAPSDVVQVHSRQYRSQRGARASHRDRVVRRGDGYYFRGHRGFRNYRPGYRRHGDRWFPAAAFLGGAILGNVLGAQPRVRYRASNAHVEWCQSRYRSYRLSDDTFQPYNGPRRRCNSPYN
jgi:hypothetical protein